jgi:rubredoxin
MKKYICDVCGTIYDPKKGCAENEVKPGTDLEEYLVGFDYQCPWCRSWNSYYSN